MRTSDLVPLFAQPAPGNTVTFRQGVVVTWNQQTAENTVLVGGSLLTNLAVLNTSEAAIIVPGDVVGILVSGATWGVLGRFTIPGTPEAVTAIKSITDRIQAVNDPNSGSRNSTSFGDLTGAEIGPALTSKIGPSGRALVLWSCEIGQTVDYMTVNTPHVSVEVSGATSVAATADNAINFSLAHPPSAFTGYALSQFWIQCAVFHLFTDLNPGDNTFTMKYKHDGETPSEAVNFQARELAVFAL